MADRGRHTPWWSQHEEGAEIQDANIVFIMADDMGCGSVGCSNPDSRIPGPYMDRLAAEGIRLTDGHAPDASRAVKLARSLVG